MIDGNYDGGGLIQEIGFWVFGLILRRSDDSSTWA